jgi:hypothetical protein
MRIVLSRWLVKIGWSPAPTVAEQKRESWAQFARRA